MFEKILNEQKRTEPNLIRRNAIMLWSKHRWLCIILFISFCCVGFIPHFEPTIYSVITFVISAISLFVSVETLSKDLQRQQEKWEMQTEQADLPPLLSNLYEIIMQKCGTISEKTIDILRSEGELYIQDHPHRLFISAKGVFSSLASSIVTYMFTLLSSQIDSSFFANISQNILYLVYVLIGFALLLSFGYLVQTFADPFYNAPYYRAQQLRMDLADLKIKLLAKDAPQAILSKFE